MKKVLFVLMALALGFSACRGSSSPTSPTPVVPPGTPPTGEVTFTYSRQEAGLTACRAAGTPKEGFCRFPVVMTADPNSPWGAYKFTGLRAIEVSENVFSLTVTVPLTVPPARLGIAVGDGWKCSPDQNVCNDSFWGRGISANGVRLKDSDGYTYFSFIPPNVYP
jgi:hypothetical protein